MIARSFTKVVRLALALGACLRQLPSCHWIGATEFSMQAVYNQADIRRRLVAQRFPGAHFRNSAIFPFGSMFQVPDLRRENRRPGVLSKLLDGNFARRVDRKS